MPRHLGIILDSNRRSVQAKRIIEAHLIYEAGAANKLDDVLDWCGGLRIRAVTLCLFLSENLKRPADEVPGIFSAIQGKLRKFANDPEIHRLRVRVKAMGSQLGGTSRRSTASLTFAV